MFKCKRVINFTRLQYLSESLHFLSLLVPVSDLHQHQGRRLLCPIPLSECTRAQAAHLRPELAATGCPGWSWLMLSAGLTSQVVICWVKWSTTRSAIRWLPCRSQTAKNRYDIIRHKQIVNKSTKSWLFVCGCGWQANSRFLQGLIHAWSYCYWVLIVYTWRLVVLRNVKS